MFRKTPVCINFIFPLAVRVVIGTFPDRTFTMWSSTPPALSIQFCGNGIIRYATSQLRSLIIIIIISIIVITIIAWFALRRADSCWVALVYAGSRWFALVYAGSSAGLRSFALVFPGSRCVALVRAGSCLLALVLRGSAFEGVGSRPVPSTSLS